jgi:class 3 adenylate cyclase
MSLLMKATTAIATVGMVDLCGFTGFTRRVGDRQALNTAIALYEWVEECLQGRATVVKTLGDGMLLTSLDAGGIEDSFHRMLSGWDGPLKLRAAARRGPVLLHEGDVFGDVVNTVAHELG